VQYQFPYKYNIFKIKILKWIIISAIYILEKLKIVITSHATSLKDFLSSKLSDLGLTAETVDYNKTSIATDCTCRHTYQWAWKGRQNNN
jgi:hypothetical protein